MIPCISLCKIRIEALLNAARDRFMVERAQTPQDTIELLTAVSHLSTLKAPHSCDPH